MSAVPSTASIQSSFDDTGPSLAELYYTDEVDMTLLGRGKYSVVHRTRRRTDELPVALKTIQASESARSRAQHGPEAAGIWLGAKFREPISPLIA